MSRDFYQYPSAYPERNNSSSRPSDTSTSPTSPPYPESRSTQMATLPPPSHVQPQIAYRPHASYAMYSPHSQSFPPSQQPPPNTSQQPPNFPPQPAPRQRTAIACQYCRRRKIRCHGFDTSPQGKCTNCVRFHQDCMFLPVSTQGHVHAFVPAHTAYPILRTGRPVQTGPDGRPLPYAGQSGPPIFNHQGQPIHQLGQHDPAYSSHQSPASYMAPPFPPHPPQTLPPPTQAPHGHYDERGPPPASDHRVGTHRGSAAYEYPDPTAMAPTSPATSPSSYQSGTYSSSSSQPYYQSPSGVNRVSPTSSYFPRGMPGGNGTNVLPPLPPDLHPPLALPSGHDGGRNTSPNTSNSRTGGLSVSDMLTPTGSGRSSTDNDMLSLLNKGRR